MGIIKMPKGRVDEENPMFGKHHSKKTKKKLSLAMKNRFGKKAPNWKGGRRKNGQYTLIFVPKHPFKTKEGYILEHRQIMEEYLRKYEPDHPALIEVDRELYLRPDWVPHHKNGIKDDNRLENLKVMTDSKHKSYHMSGKKNPFFNHPHHRDITGRFTTGDI